MNLTNRCFLTQKKKYKVELSLNIFNDLGINGSAGHRLSNQTFVFRVEDDGDHGQAVEVETDLVAQEVCADAHVKRYPEIDESDVDVQAVFCDDEVADNIDKERRDAEPEEDGGFAQIEESRQSDDQQQYDRIDGIREFSDAVKIQLQPLRCVKIYLKYNSRIFR